MGSPVERFLTGSYTIKRSKSGSYHQGHFIPGPEETIQVKGSMQPTDARKLRLSQEGSRLTQYWKFFTDAPVVTINTKSLGRADTVTINGETYKVISQEIWQNFFDLNYYKSILAREPEQ